MDSEKTLTLPKLKKIDKFNKKHVYHLKDSSIKRRRAIDEGVYSEALKTNKTRKQAANSKKLGSIFCVYIAEITIQKIVLN